MTQKLHYFSQLLELTGGFFSHVTRPVTVALETWGGTMDEITEVTVKRFSN